MKILSKTGIKELATVYIAQMRNGRWLEFVESQQPKIPIRKKWVLIISTLYGCPVKCKICDAGMYYYGKVSKEDLFAQIDYLVIKRYPDRFITAEKFKIQFARMGDPAFNLNVLNIIEEFDDHYTAPGFLPSVSTIAPLNTDHFFERLHEIKERKFSSGRFQFQFSIHTTDSKLRDELIPVNKWKFEQMAKYGEKFRMPGDKKIALNFTLINNYPVEPDIVYKYFNPQDFIIKLTPLNPTYKAKSNGLTSFLKHKEDSMTKSLIERFNLLGYEVILSLGASLENQIGSNCGQFVLTHLSSKFIHQAGYKLIKKRYASN
jgi:23S rRNA (adenine2503-C2)-methyltransferase